MKRSFVLLGMLALLSGCHESSHDAEHEAAGRDAAPAENVLARFDGGSVTVADVDAHILRMPASERPPPGADLEAWYTRLIRALVVDRELLREARETELEDSEAFRLRRIAVQRQLAVQSCLAEWKPDSGTVSPDEIRAAYEARSEQLRAPERRSTYQIFRRIDPGESAQAVESRMLELRERVLRGENFQRLARAESESESRHRQGSIGWIVRGQLPEAIEDVVFSLEEGVPSRPLATPDGVHLFQVDEILPERELSLRDATPVLRSELEAASVGAALDEIAALNASPAAQIVDRRELDRLIELGDEQAAVLTTDDYVLTLAQFRLRLGRVMGEQGAFGDTASSRVSSDAAWALLGRMHRHEKAYEMCVGEGRVAETAVATLMDDWMTDALTSRMREVRLMERVTGDTDRLMLFYQSNLGQFTPAVEWNLRRLSVTFDNADQGNALMARLEDAAAANSTGLDSLQQEVGGTLEDLGWRTLQQMRRVNPRLPQLVSPLDGKALVAPLRVDDGLVLFQVLSRRESEPRPFEEVREAVASAFLRQYTSEVYEDLERDILENVGFELFPERLGKLREAGLPAPEITVEQLDALFGDT